MTSRVTVRLTPRGGRDHIDGWDGDVLRVRVAAPPAEGRANEAMLRLVAKALRVPVSHVSLVSGSQSRLKLLAIEGLDAADIRARL